MSNEAKNRIAGNTSRKEPPVAVIEETTAVAPAQPTQVATKTAVQGMSISFPYAKVYYTVAKWEPEEGIDNAQQGAFYLQATKNDKPIRIANTGIKEGFNAILLGAICGWKEDRPYDPMNPNRVAPRRFATKEEAEKAGLRTWWLDDPTRMKPNGRPMGIPPEASEYCYLRVLAPIPEDKLEKFSTGEYLLIKIGEIVYTPMCVEFTKQACRRMKECLTNLEQAERMRHLKDKNYKFQLPGMVAHIYTDRPQGQPVPFLYLKAATRDGNLWKFTKEEQEDLVNFLMATKPGEVTQEEANQAASDDKEW